MNNWALPCQQKMFSFSLCVLFVRDQSTRGIFALPINWNLWNIPLFQSPKTKTAKACQAESMTKLFEMSSGAKQFKNQLLRYVEVLVEVDIEKWCFILFSLEDPMKKIDYIAVAA